MLIPVLDFTTSQNQFFKTNKEPISLVPGWSLTCILRRIPIRPGNPSKNSIHYWDDVKITNYVIRRARPPIMFQHANEDRLGGVGQVVRLIGLSVVTCLHLWRIGAFSLPVSNLVAATATCSTLDFLDRHVAAHMVLSTTWPVVGISLVLALAVALRKSIASAELLFLFAFQRLRVGLLLLKDRTENLRRLALVKNVVLGCLLWLQQVIDVELQLFNLRICCDVLLVPYHLPAHALRSL